MTTLIAGHVSKYRNTKTLAFGILFDSKREADRYMELRSLQDAGKISNLETQVRYPLKVNGQLICTYIADFVYAGPDGITVEDAKGFRTPVYRLKKKLMSAIYEIDVKEV